MTAFSEKLKRHVELVDAHNDGAKMMFVWIRPLTVTRLVAESELVQKKLRFSTFFTMFLTV